MGVPEIEDLRRRIDELDREIVRLLEERMSICRRLGEIKRAHNMPILDSAREKIVLERAGVFREVFSAIIELCRRAQEAESP